MAKTGRPKRDDGEKRLHVPDEAIELRTMTDLQRYLNHFVAGIYPFVWLTSRVGAGKTEVVKSLLRGVDHVYIDKKQPSPLQFYITCYHNRGKPTVLDDAEPFVADPDGDGRRLVMSFGETCPGPRHMNWPSTTPRLGEVPQDYYTTSPLLMLANGGSKDPALCRRATTLFWNPTSVELHRYAATWFHDQQIYDWIGQRIHALKPLRLDWYTRLAQHKRAGEDWRALALDAYAHNRADCIVQQLERERPDLERRLKANLFVEAMHGQPGASTATYNRIVARLKKAGTLGLAGEPSIPVRGRPPSRHVWTVEELDQLAATGAPPPEPEPPPLSPARQAFAQPIDGNGVAPAAVRRRDAADETAHPAIDPPATPPPDDEDGE